MARVVVTGAGGFIGGHLVKRLLDEDHEVLAVDRKPFIEWHQKFSPTQYNVSNHQKDLRYRENCVWTCAGADIVYNLAADMGGMGFIETHKTDCMLSVLISTHMLQAAAQQGVKNFFYSSSACVYAADKQTDPNVTALKESDAYPAEAEDGYGWEKLFSERLGRHYMEDAGLRFRTARYHNVYGPHGTWHGGREKAPAAICRKVIEGMWGNGEIEIWGDGEQTRSFMYVDDCVEGTRRIMDSDITYPINLGSSELVSINQLVSIVEDIAGVELDRKYDLSAPQGVRGRNSDNTLIKQELDWEPSISLREGLEKTYEWIYNEMLDD